MALCPYCHSEKPVAAPVCHSCNSETGFLFTLGMNILGGIMTLGLWVFTMWALFKLITM